MYENITSMFNDCQLPATRGYSKLHSSCIHRYDISYKQKVTSEDMFLGMSGKNPSTACCEDMIVKIELPGCNMKDVELDVKQTTLDCRSKKL